MVELLQMWALVEVLGIICLPLTVTIFKNLPDRGWACTKVVGIALLAFCVWLPLTHELRNELVGERSLIV